MTSVVLNQSKSSQDVNLELEYEIEEDVEAELEEFVRLNHIGQFKEAHELFDECLRHHADWYPISAEYADLLLREGKLEQLATFSLNAATMFQDPVERTLFKLMKVIGDLSSKDVMWQRLQDIWPTLSIKPPYTSLRDTDIHLLEITLQILVVTERHPSDLDVSLREAPSAWEEKYIHTTIRWTVFKDWFRYLLLHEHFWEAQRILQSLFHVLSRLECQHLVQAFVEKAVTTNAGQESVKISISSLVQRFIYVFENIHPNPLAVVQWNDAITWALFGVTLAKASEESTSMFSRICLRRSLQEDHNMNRVLPLVGVDGNDEMNQRLCNAIPSGFVQVWRWIQAERTGYTQDELYSGMLISTTQFDPAIGMVLQFLNPRTVDMRDGYQRTALHWASLNGQAEIIELLIKIGNANAGLLDWCGCTSLHYAVRGCSPKSTTEHIRAVKALLLSGSAGINTRNPSGLTPLQIAILSGSYDVAKLLLEHDAIIDDNDYNLVMGHEPDSKRWEQLLSEYDHLQPPSYGENSPKSRDSFTPAIEARSHANAPSNHPTKNTKLALLKKNHKSQDWTTTHSSSLGKEPDPRLSSANFSRSGAHRFSAPCLE